MILRLCLGFFVCLLTAVLAEGQCPYKCTTLDPNVPEAWYIAGLGNSDISICFAYADSYGDDMYSTDPAGQRMPTNANITRMKYDDCAYICTDAKLNTYKGSQEEVPSGDIIQTTTVDGYWCASS